MSELFKLVFENESFAIIEKFHGVSYHGDGLHEALRELLGHEVFGVHRLDKVTSGLLIFAKDKKSASDFTRLFEEKKIEKHYYAISNKRPSKKQGLVKGDMQKARGGNWTLLRTLVNPAITKFESLNALENGFRLFSLFPKTGKTHQLRVMMKSLGSPILGDTRYGGEESDRAYLHAYSLRFVFDGEDFFFKTSPTGEFWNLFSI